VLSKPAPLAFRSGQPWFQFLKHPDPSTKYLVSHRDFFIRTMSELGLRLGNVRGASGSSYVELNETKVFAAV
jgi:hypothetical protein